MDMQNKNHTRKHIIMMALACVIPLLLVILLSFLGFDGKIFSLFAIILMIVLHLVLMKGHGGHK